jgi:transposase
LSTDIKGLADQDPACERQMTVPGIGPIISSAMVAAIDNGTVCSKGRDFGAWLGLVPAGNEANAEEVAEIYQSGLDSVKANAGM